MNIPQEKTSYCSGNLNYSLDLLVNLILRNISPNYVDIEETFDMNSDHSPVILIYYQKIIRKLENPV